MSKSQTRSSEFDVPELSVQNVVGTIDLGLELNLSEVQQDLMGSQYSPEKFNGVVYRIQDPKSSNLIFRTGSIVSTGCGSVQDSKVALQQTLDDLSDLGIDTSESGDPEIVNVVCSGDFGSSFNLNAVSIAFGLENVEYEPEQFPGAIYRIEDSGLAALLFASGKVVVVGASKRSEAKDGLQQLTDKLNEYDLL